MKVFIDFDDVIFNTKDFSIYLKGFYASRGVSQELVQKYYYDPAAESELKLFNPEGLFLRLEQYEKIDVSKLRKNFTQQLKHLSRFVFDDVSKFLTKMSKENVYLVSFGLPTFQSQKIQGSGVNKLVSDYIVTEKMKGQAIVQVMEKNKIDFEEKLIFIDDRIAQIEDVKKTFPQALTFLLCRKEGRYCDQKNDYCDYVAGDLRQVMEIISGLE
ncbi:MAG: hypothetical protein WCF93_02670 [Candidatus Moraniibacteriota bacterium]|jgi:hypothetical protein